jgi:hypothetical protein
MSLSFGVEASEKWFIQLWNYTILPYLNDMVKMKLIVNNFSSVNVKQVDPVDWILGNYPWPKSGSSSQVPPSQRLLRLKIYENYLFKSTRSSASSDPESDPGQNSPPQVNCAAEDNNDCSSNQQLVRFFKFL